MAWPQVGGEQLVLEVGQPGQAVWLAGLHETAPCRPLVAGTPVGMAQKHQAAQGAELGSAPYPSPVLSLGQSFATSGWYSVTVLCEWEGNNTL